MVSTKSLTMYKVSEIFTSIEGEGPFSGTPTTFIRLYGCNLICSYCDTRYACDFEDDGLTMPPGYEEVELAEILARVRDRGVNHVSVTGGEPLCHENCSLLLGNLLQQGNSVTVETNGSLSVPEAHNAIGSAMEPNLYWNIDYKLPGSGYESMMRAENLDFAVTNPERCIVKFVISDQKDLKRASEVILEWDLKRCYFSMAKRLGRTPLITLPEIADYIIRNRHILDGRIRLQVQMHKIIWPADKRGV